MRFLKDGGIDVGKSVSLVGNPIFEAGRKRGAVEAYKMCRALLCDYELDRIEKVSNVQKWLEAKFNKLGELK